MRFLPTHRIDRTVHPSAQHSPVSEAGARTFLALRPAVDRAGAADSGRVCHLCSLSTPQSPMGRIHPVAIHPLMLSRPHQDPSSSPAPARRERHPT